MTVIRKARRPSAAERIDRAAARFSPALARVVREAVARIRDRATLDRIAEALEAGTVARVLAELNVDIFAEELQRGDDLSAALRDTFAEGARAARASLPKSIGIEASFDLLNPRSVDAIRRNELRLIRQVTDETRNAVRSIVTRGFEEGIEVRRQARLVRDVVGLTENQSQAVVNFRTQLEQRTNTPDGRAMQPAGARRLSAPERARAARHIREGGLTRREIDDLVETYRQRLVNRRAENIARTETLRAANDGNLEQWRQAGEQGLLPRDVRRRWITARDERVRDEHRVIPGLNQDGVGLNEPFRTPMGPVMNPPAGVNCRCTTVLMIPEGS